jgi:hypothetical protein
MASAGSLLDPTHAIIPVYALHVLRERLTVHVLAVVGWLRGSK